MNELPLRDIHLPNAVSWWPLATGWWVFIICLILLLLTALYFFYLKPKTVKPPAYKKIALHQLQSLRQICQQSNSRECLSEISSLLRRTAISFYPREQVASLTGMAWINTLNQISGSTCFTEQHAILFSQARYQPEPEYDAAQLFETCQQWMQQLPESINSKKPLETCNKHSASKVTA